jgi:HAE1 family hydrophobic/amphiphilic exporter-1
VTFGGTWREMQETLAAIARSFVLSAGLVLLVLAAQFESVRLPLVIFAAVPLALVGVAAALLLTQGTINALSGIGLVVLVGLVVNDSILKVDLLRRLREEGVPRREAIFTAGMHRYRPILMTTLTTALGLAPLFFGSGAELRAPLAAVLIGGLVSSTFLTLLVIPVLFDRVDRRAPS